MARFKVIKPKFENPKLRLAKKRERIRRTVDVIWAVLMFVSIFIGGLNQQNDFAVGVVLIVTGIINFPMAAFYLYMEIREWDPLICYDFSVSKITNKKDVEGNRVTRVVSIIALVSFAIILPILGILRLNGLA